MLDTLTYPYTLPSLPYQFDALEPIIDAQTMEIHHDKHHASYIAKLNEALKPYTDLQQKNLTELLSGIANLPEEIRQVVINHGGGHANHTIFWNTLRPNQENNNPQGTVLDFINSTFGDMNTFKTTFTTAASNRFGSGWAWLIFDPEKNVLEITSTSNQDSPLLVGQFPILGLDVWEHAYYLKYQNHRIDYINAWWNIINWEEANKTLEILL
ncbi:superoxide dismutase [candidate division WWE3 bacterium]|nr:superoxide dismutase [candidate division WWE3 bacterium]